MWTLIDSFHLDVSSVFLYAIQAGRGSSNRSVGARVLATLDRFALSAYDEKSQPELKIKGLSKSNTWLCMLTLIVTFHVLLVQLARKCFIID